MKQVSHNAAMQTTKSVEVRRKGASGVALTGAIIAFVGLTTLATRTATTASWSPSNPNRTSYIEGMTTYQRYARALEMIERGDDRQARQVLDSVRRDPLVISAGGVGDGVMQSLSPSSLLMQLTKTLGQKAERASQAGNDAEARLWLGYGYQIAKQIAETPKPNVDALALAHFVDMQMAGVESREAARTGDETAWTAARQRTETLNRAWREDVLPRLPERVITALGIEMRSEEDAARLNRVRNRYCLYRMQAGIVTG